MNDEALERGRQTYEEVRRRACEVISEDLWPPWLELDESTRRSWAVMADVLERRASRG